MSETSFRKAHIAIIHMALQQLLSFHAFHAPDVTRALYRGAALLFNLLILSKFST